jgi:hypothetical protein
MRRALIVGIDDYSTGPLSGCVNDAHRVSALLSKHADGTPNFDCRVEVAPPSPITRTALRECIAELFTDPPDVALFYFSGHGFLDSFGGYLVTQDAERYDEGVAMAELLTFAANSTAREVIIILDCCFSGDFGRLPAISADRTLLRDGVAVLTACGPEQTALEAGGGGILTSLLCEALDGGASDVMGNVTVGSLYGYVDQALGAWEQRPMLKACLCQFTAVRRCHPQVQPGVLRLLTKYFDLPMDEFALDPSYEPDAEPHDPGHELIFSHLQQYRAARLLVPVGEEHLYYAAIHSKACKLTPLGRFYWRLASKGKI